MFSENKHTQIIGIKIEVQNDRALFGWLDLTGGLGMPCLEQFMLRIVTFRVYSHAGREPYFLRLYTVYDRLFGA